MKTIKRFACQCCCLIFGLAAIMFLCAPWESPEVSYSASIVLTMVCCWLVRVFYRASGMDYDDL